MRKPAGTPTAPVLRHHVETSWLDGKHVRLRRVIEGQDLGPQLEALGSRSGATKAEVAITESGSWPSRTRWFGRGWPAPFGRGGAPCALGCPT